MSNLEHIYYNLSILNNSITNNKQIARFYESRAEPIIEDPINYEMSIIRFSMNNIKTIPILIPLIETSQTDINRTIYKITLQLIKNNGPVPAQGVYEHTLNIIYEPQKEYINSLPYQPLEKQELTNEYYFIYSYDHFTNLINKTLIQLYNLINADIINNGGSIQSQNAIPYFYYNTEINKFELYTSTNNYGEDRINIDEEFKIYFNTSLFSLISGFPHIYKTNVGDKNYELIIRNNFNNIINRIDSTATLTNLIYYKTIEEYNSTYNFSPCSEIVFVSNFLHVNYEYESNPLIITDDNIITGDTSNLFNNVITDIQLPIDNGHDYNNFIQYIPSEKRFTNIISSQSIKEIDILIFWRLKYNNTLIPVYMSPNSNITMKIYFRRKNII